MLAILTKAYCINVVVEIKLIYLNKRYLFQNKDKKYLSFAKVKLSKTTSKTWTRTLKNLDPENPGP